MQERILAYGGTGGGKSYAWLSLAKSTQSVKFYCIDTDKAIHRMLATEFKELSNVIVKDCRDWHKCDLALDEITKIVKEEDWLVIDMVDALWDFVQSYYTQQIFSKNIDDYFIQVRKSLGGGAKLEAFKGWTDWTVINKLYQDFINRVTYDLSCNIFLTAKASKYNSSQDDEPSLRDSFSVVGFKPEGEKRNAYRVHTVLYFNHDAFGYYVTTVKDRGRQQLRGMAFNNFANLYDDVINNKEIKPVESESSITSDDILYKAFGRFLDKNKIKWSEAKEIAGENGEIADYKIAQIKIKEYYKNKGRELQ